MTCSHMSYFFISKQLLWELFFRISNSKGSQIVATGINDIDNPPIAIILRTTVNPVGLPEGLGSNGCIVIQQNPNNAFNCQLAFSFGSDKIAIRRKRNSNAWTDWKYFSAE